MYGTWIGNTQLSRQTLLHIYISSPDSVSSVFPYKVRLWSQRLRLDLAQGGAAHLRDRGAAVVPAPPASSSPSSSDSPSYTSRSSASPSSSSSSSSCCDSSSPSSSSSDVVAVLAGPNLTPADLRGAGPPVDLRAVTVAPRWVVGPNSAAAFCAYQVHEGGRGTREVEALRAIG